MTYSLLSVAHCAGLSFKGLEPLRLHQWGTPLLHLWLPRFTVRRYGRFRVSIQSFPYFHVYLNAFFLFSCFLGLLSFSSLLPLLLSTMIIITKQKKKMYPTQWPDDKCKLVFGLFWCNWELEELILHWPEELVYSIVYISIEQLASNCWLSEYLMCLYL